MATPVEGALVRRVRLPNDRRTPAAARALVRAVLEEAALDGLLNEALLLTTELSTNAVVHAGTELDIEVAADLDGLTVTVTDFAPGPVEQLAVGPKNDKVDIGEVAERGRGLLLVDHFASRWGTVHQGTGKGVWFRLERKGAAAAVELPDESAAPSVGALTALLQIDPERHTDEGLAEFATDLLSRLSRLTGAAGGVVRLDRGDGGGRQLLARFGRAPRDDAATIRVPLTVQRPYSGELELDASPIGYAQPLARIVAERFSLHLENDRLRRTDLRRQTWLTFLAEASELLAQSLDVNLTMALIPQLVVPRLGQWSAVHTTDAWGRLQLAAATHADEAALPELYAMLAESGPDSILARLEEARTKVSRCRWWPGEHGWARSPSGGTSSTGTTRTRSPCWRTWPAGPRWRSTTPGSTTSAARSPGRCRPRCCRRRCPGSRASVSPPSTSRPAPRWAATSTTSCPRARISGSSWSAT
jgi:sigma-B regulation protein RsbU (phosphoserine phosphatase)